MWNICESLLVSHDVTTVFLKSLCQHRKQKKQCDAGYCCICLTARFCLKTRIKAVRLTGQLLSILSQEECFYEQLACFVCQHKPLSGPLIKGKKKQIFEKQLCMVVINAAQHINDKSAEQENALLTLWPPVLSFMGRRNGSKIMWLVSMLTGDCLFPTEHKFQAEFTKPQKDGTAKQKRDQDTRITCSNEIGTYLHFFVLLVQKVAVLKDLALFHYC